MGQEVQGGVKTRISGTREAIETKPSALESRVWVLLGYD